MTHGRIVNGVVDAFPVMTSATLRMGSHLWFCWPALCDQSLSASRRRGGEKDAISEKPALDVSRNRNGEYGISTSAFIPTRQAPARTTVPQSDVSQGFEHLEFH